MADPDPRRQIAYELRAPVSGMGLKDPRSAALFWAIGSILLGILIMALLITGEIRILTLILISLLGLVSLSPRRGIYILTLFLPFMYAIRRWVLTYEEFSRRDPILLFPVIVTVAIFAGVILFDGQRIFHYFRHSPLLKACSLLVGVFVFQMVNPLQGNLLVGLVGGMFFITPALWAFLGLGIDKETVQRLLRIVTVIGTITAIYGIYQHFFGLSDVENYEVKAKGFYKAFGLHSNVRVMSTFASLVDFSRYLTISGFLAFAWFWRQKRGLLMLGIVALHLFALLFTASRTSYLVLFFSCAMLMVISGTNVRAIAVRGLAIVLAAVVLYGVLYQYDPHVVYNQQFSTNPYVVHTVSGITHPTEEGSFKTRLKAWTKVTVTTFTTNMAGHGLGSTVTSATGKFEGGEFYEVDSYFFELFWGSGLPAPVLFIVIGTMSLRGLVKLRLVRPEEYLYKVCFGLMCGAFLSSVFGISLRDTISGPLGWLLIGWTARELVASREVALAGVAAAATTGPAAVSA
ncbi:MAG TPA: hypothetical protein VGK94_06940 [Candidatus Polarisedimenticolia bacterium]|jgi:uncharacterized membrane protein